ncbi:hypothetical protein [Burkholderia phage FLC8]|nr:hypothetical protein [Burkholderia phage FLC8]
MDAMMYVGMSGAIAAVVSGIMAYRHKQNNKRARFKDYKFVVVADTGERKRRDAIRELNKTLRHKLDSYRMENPDVTGNMTGMMVAQRIAEEVFYEWLNHNFGLFYCAMADSKIEITGSHNGFFQYRLPQQLEQYKG